MAAIDTIRELAQDVYFSVNGAENDDTDDDLTAFENNFIRGFNLWLNEYETETYWNQVRENNVNISTINDTETYVFPISSDYRTPVFSPDKYVKFISDGIVIAQFKLVDPNQTVVDDEIFHPDRATFINNSIVLSRAPKEEEAGAEVVLDLVRYFPPLTRRDATSIDLIYNKNIATLGVAKNITLADVTKVSLSPSFAQRYNNELQKAIMANNASNELDSMRGDDYSTIGAVY